MNMHADFTSKTFECHSGGIPINRVNVPVISQSSHVPWGTPPDGTALTGSITVSCRGTDEFDKRGLQIFETENGTRFVWLFKGGTPSHFDSGELTTPLPGSEAERCNWCRNNDCDPGETYCSTCLYRRYECPDCDSLIFSGQQCGCHDSDIPYAQHDILAHLQAVKDTRKKAEDWAARVGDREMEQFMDDLCIEISNDDGIYYNDWQAMAIDAREQWYYKT